MPLLFRDIESAAFIAAGAVMMVVPAKVAARRQRAHDLRLADRLARGSDAYFEELRSLQAYQPMKRIGAIRLVGLLFAALGLADFYLKFH
jgi:hypothetical protein